MKKKIILLLIIVLVIVVAYFIYENARITTFGEVISNYEIKDTDVKSVEITHYEYSDKYKAITSDKEFIKRILNEPSDTKLKESKPCGDLPDFDLIFNVDGGSYTITLCDDNITLLNTSILESSKEIGEYKMVKNESNIFNEIIMRSNFDWNKMED